jgi:hypothetical protein
MSWHRVVVVVVVVVVVTIQRLQRAVRLRARTTKRGPAFRAVVGVLVGERQGCPRPLHPRCTVCRQGLHQQQHQIN